MVIPISFPCKIVYYFTGFIRIVPFRQTGQVFMVNGFHGQPERRENYFFVPVHSNVIKIIVEGIIRFIPKARQGTIPVDESI